MDHKPTDNSEDIFSRKFTASVLDSLPVLFMFAVVNSGVSKLEPAKDAGKT